MKTVGESGTSAEETTPILNERRNECLESFRKLYEISDHREREREILGLWVGGLEQRAREHVTVNGYECFFISFSSVHVCMRAPENMLI